MIYTGTIIEELLTEGGVTCFTVQNSHGHVFSPCFRAGGGGFPRVFASAPYGLGSEVIVCSVDGNRTGPFYVLAGICSSDDLTALALRKDIFVDNLEYSTFTEEDMCWRNTSTALNLVGGEQPAIVATAPSINLQLRGGTLRISSDQLAQNRLLNAGKTIETLVSYIDEVNTKLDQLQRAISLAGPGVTAAYEAAAAAATAAGNPVLASELTRQAAELAQALTDLQGGLPVSTAGTMDTRLKSGINSKISIP